MSTSFDDQAVRSANDVSKEIQAEKGPHPVETSSNDGFKSDVDSEKFQPGVQRVRAITEIWSKQSMIAMFVL